MRERAAQGAIGKPTCRTPAFAGVTEAPLVTVVSLVTETPLATEAPVVAEPLLVAEPPLGTRPLLMTRLVPIQLYAVLA